MAEGKVVTIASRGATGNEQSLLMSSPWDVVLARCLGKVVQLLIYAVTDAISNTFVLSELPGILE